MMRILLNYGFPLILAALVVLFGLLSPGFQGLAGIMGILHAMVPIVVVASGMALVVMLGKPDTSVGEIGFAGMSMAAVLIAWAGWPPLAASAVALGVGAVLGALNGFVVVVLRVNPLIATLGTMIGFRGLALQITDSRVMVLPDAMRNFGNWTLLPVFFDVVLAGAILLAAHLVHRETPFGRTITAIGNDEAAARRIGLPVGRTAFACYVISGMLGAHGGVLGAAQVGAVTTFLGKGMEFTAVAVVVVGGISLFGRGSVFWGVLLGALTFEIIRAGLNHVGANPCFYQLIGGGIIFVAMYAAALKARETRLQD